LFVQRIQPIGFIGLHREKLPLVAPDAAALAALIELDQRAGVAVHDDFVHVAVALRAAQHPQLPVSARPIFAPSSFARSTAAEGSPAIRYSSAMRRSMGGWLESRSASLPSRSSTERRSGLMKNRCAVPRVAL